MKQYLLSVHMVEGAPTRSDDDAQQAFEQVARLNDELIGGFWVIVAADLDEALAWAAKATHACGEPVEIRPFQEDPEG